MAAQAERTGGMMALKFNPYALPLFGGGILLVALAVMIWRRRQEISEELFTLVLGAQAFWMLAYGMELMGTNLATVDFWGRVSYLSIVSITSFWLLFVLAFVGQVWWLKPRTLLLLAVVPVLSLVALWTNDLHHLFWTAITLADNGSFVYRETIHGPLFWVHTAYSYSVSMLAAIILIRSIRRRRPALYRFQTGLLLAAWLVAMLGNVFTLLDLTPVHGLDMTPVGFGLAALLIAWNMYQYRLMDIVPSVQSRVLDSIEDSVIVVDARQRVVDLNAAAEHITGLKASDIVGQPVERVFAPFGDYTQRFAHVSSFHTELASGPEKTDASYYDLRITPLHSQRGRLAGRVIVLRDITAQKQATLALEVRNRELDAFSHSVAHDLRSPLALVIGYLTLVEQDADRVPLDMLEFVTEARQSAENMSSMIESMLLLAQLRGDSQVTGRVNMDVVVQSAVGRFRMEIEGRGVTVDIQPHLPDAQGYGPWLEEVVANLVSNAIKYIGRENRDPRIIICGAAQDGLVRYEVQDNGVGIEPADQEKLFELFSRFHKSEAGGFGLGLSIVSQIVTKLHGTLGVESEPGQGSTFWFTLPAAETAGPD
jgi:PAS domain S-box-containing protein